MANDAKPPRPVQAPKRRDSSGSKRGFDRRWLWGGLIVLALAGLAVGLAVAFSGGDSNSSSNSSTSASGESIDWSAIPHLQEGPPPWPNDSDNLPDRLQPLGLSQLTEEGTVLHIHQHLDVWRNGEQVVLPAGIGIYDNSFITEVHTHDESGIVHVESPTKKTFTLGQLFGQWGVKLTQHCLGSDCSGVSWWVNGVKQTGDPSALALAEHQVIVVSTGKTPPTIRKTYSWGSL
jgi:hypothetical protein